MATYEIRYDYCSEDGLYEDRNCVETFYGDWEMLQDYLKVMRERGTYYNIYASCIYEEDDEYAIIEE